MPVWSVYDIIHGYVFTLRYRLLIKLQILKAGSTVIDPIVTR